MKTGCSSGDRRYPFILSAGEHNASATASRFRDPESIIRINPEDAARLAIADGELIVCESQTESIEATARIDDSVGPGCLSLPQGFGLTHCFAVTPQRKSIPVRIRKFRRDETLA